MGASVEGHRGSSAPSPWRRSRGAAVEEANEVGEVESERLGAGRPVELTRCFKGDQEVPCMDDFKVTTACVAGDGLLLVVAAQVAVGTIRASRGSVVAGSRRRDGAVKGPHQLRRIDLASFL